MALLIHSLFTLCIALSHFSLTAADEGCVPNYKDFLIEFVLNQDATYSYVSFVDQLKNFVMPSLVKEIESQFPGSKFGLTTFGDWEFRTYDSRDRCYTFYSPLTTNSTAFLQKVRNVQVGDGADPPESSLLGMSLSVTDPKMGWSNEQVSSDGKRIVKVLAMATDDESLMPHHKSSGKVFKGDSTDNCDCQAPEIKSVGKVFRERDVFFLGLISGSDIKEIWEGYLKKMGSKGVISALETTNPEQLIKVVMDGIKEIICIPTTSTIPPSTSPTSSSPPSTSPPSTAATEEEATEEQNSEEGGIPVAAIAGASVGAVALLAVGGGAAYYKFGRQADAGMDGRFEDVEEAEEGADREVQAVVEDFT